MSMDDNWIAVARKMPPKGEVVMVSNGKSGDAHAFTLARLQDGWLDPYEAEIEKERGEGEGIDALTSAAPIR